MAGAVRCVLRHPCGGVLGFIRHSAATLSLSVPAQAHRRSLPGGTKRDATAPVDQRHCLPPSASGLQVTSQPFLASFTPGPGGGAFWGSPPPAHLPMGAPLPCLSRPCYASRNTEPSLLERSVRGRNGPERGRGGRVPCEASGLWPWFRFARDLSTRPLPGRAPSCKSHLARRERDISLLLSGFSPSHLRI